MGGDGNYWVAARTFLDSLGWLGNLTAIVSVAGGGFWLIHRLRRWLARKERSLESAIERLVGDEAAANRRWLRSQTAVVLDDNPDDFPLEYLRTMFRSLKVLESLSLSDWQRLEKFDWIFLDVKGVVPEDMESGGLEILKRVKESQAGPIVAAVSSKRFDPTITEYFQLAEITLKKPLSPADCEERILGYVSRKRGCHALARSIDRDVQKAEGESADLIRGQVMAICEIGQATESLRKLASASLGPAVAESVIARTEMLRDAVRLTRTSA